MDDPARPSSPARDSLSHGSTLLLLLDWDETITISDTTALICGAFGPDCPAAIQERFGFYVQEYERLLAEHACRCSPRKTIADEIAYLGSLRVVEDGIQALIEADGFFARPEFSPVAHAGHVAFQPGWPQFTAWLVNAPWAVETHIISCSWSAAFIQACLPSELTSAVSSVRANEIDICHSRITRSSACQQPGGITTGADKLQEMKAIIGARRKSGWGDGDATVVYVGDSETDLPCLLSARVPLLFRPKPALLDLCRKLGITILAPHQMPPLSLPAHTFLQVVDWCQVIQILTACISSNSLAP